MGVFLAAVLIGIVEGLTEFIPVSSTGHMIIVGHLIGFKGPKADSFEVFIQLGAILAVVFLYRQRFHRLFRFGEGSGFSGRHGMLLLGLTTLPALVFGALAHGFIKDYLFSPPTVAAGLGLGGIAILVIERFLPKADKLTLDALTWRTALGVGLFQCIALWPGVSRAGATIAGAMLLRVERRTAAEYSFLAAVPVMFAAAFYDLYKSRAVLSFDDLGLFAVGFSVALVSAWLAVKYFLRFLVTHTLRGFGWYRIVLAGLTLWYFS